MKNASRSTALMRPALFVRCIIDLFIGDSLRQRVAFWKENRREGQKFFRNFSCLSQTHGMRSYQSTSKTVFCFKRAMTPESESLEKDQRGRTTLLTGTAAGDATLGFSLRLTRRMTHNRCEYRG